MASLIGRPKRIRQIKSSIIVQQVGLLFLGLKLGHVIDWHWFWVLLPWVVDFVGAGVGRAWLKERQRQRQLERESRKAAQKIVLAFTVKEAEEERKKMRLENEKQAGEAKPPVV